MYHPRGVGTHTGSIGANRGCIGRDGGAQVYIQVHKAVGGYKLPQRYIKLCRDVYRDI